MMTFGARCHDYPKADPETLFAQIAGDGFTTVQLAVKKVFPAPLYDDRTRIRAALDAASLSVGVYGCYVELGYADEEARKAEVEKFREGIRYAREYAAGCIGSETTNRAKQPAVTDREAIAAVERSLGEVLPLAEELGVTVALEPVFYHSITTPECMRDLLDTMRSPNLRVVFDPVNLLDVPDLAPARQYAMWQRAAECFGDKIMAVHIKGIGAENGVLCKRTLEDSAVDYAAVFRMLRSLGYSGPVFREEVIPAVAKQDLARMKTWADHD